MKCSACVVLLLLSCAVGVSSAGACAGEVVPKAAHCGNEIMRVMRSMMVSKIIFKAKAAMLFCNT